MELDDKSILESDIHCFAGRLLLLHVVPVAAADHCGCLVADGKPALGSLSRLDVYRSPRASHLGARPAGIDRIAQHFRPAPCQRKGERGEVQLGFGIGLSRIPRPLDPVDVLQRPFPTSMQAAAEIN